MATDAQLIATIRKHTGIGAWRAGSVIYEARKAGIGVALACGLIDVESNWRNIFGHDRGAYPPLMGKPVTRDSYRTYRHQLSHGYKHNGVGWTQLTYEGYQRAADALGGCWKVWCQMRVGYTALAGLVRRYGVRRGLAAYNAGPGSSSAGFAYADKVIARRNVWRKRLWG